MFRPAYLPCLVVQIQFVVVLIVSVIVAVAAVVRLRSAF